MQIMSSMSPLLTLCVNIGIVIVIWIGGIHSIEGEMSIGQIVAFTNYLLTTMTPLIMMTILSNLWAGGLVSARRINEVLDTVPEVSDAPDAIALPETAERPTGLRKRLFPVQQHTCRTGSGRDQSGHRAWADRGIFGIDRVGKVHAREPRPPLLRCFCGTDPARRDRYPKASGRMHCIHKWRSCLKKRFFSQAR